MGLTVTTTGDGAVTVNAHVARLVGSTTEIAAMVTLPAAMPVTVPLFTAATAGLELDQVTGVPAAPETVAVSWMLSPTRNNAEGHVMDTLIIARTVTAVLALLDGSATDVAVIEAEPGATAVTTPLFTVATAGFEVDQVTAVFV